jgi:hypothetical protein
MWSAVWKGSTSKHTELYVWELAPEVPRFEVGRTYVAVAMRLVDPKAREGAGLQRNDAIVSLRLNVAIHWHPTYWKS